MVKMEGNLQKELKSEKGRDLLGLEPRSPKSPPPRVGPITDTVASLYTGGIWHSLER